MKILGIDYGRAKIGLAIAECNSQFVGLAEPLDVIKVKNQEDALVKIKIKIKEEIPDVVVVGVSENEMGKEQEEFVNALSVSVSIPIETQDEGLSTQDAQDYAIKAGMPRGKRKKLEDAFAASLVLQSWIDAKHNRL